MSAATGETKTTGEQVLIFGGLQAGFQFHKDIIAFDPDRQASLQHSIITQTPSYNFSVCGLADSFIVTGGIDFATEITISRVKQFSFGSRSWSDLPDMLKPVAAHGSAYLDGLVYTAGGQYSEKGDIKHRYADVNVLDLAILTWTECQPLPLAVDCLGVVAVDADILAIGGDTGAKTSDASFKYNRETGQWTECQKMPKTGYIFKSTVVVNRQVFVLDQSMFLQYDVPSDSWTELPLPVSSSTRCAIFQTEGRLVAMGGYDKNMKDPNDRAQTYDLASKTWRLEKYTMPVAVFYHSTIVVKLSATK